MYILYVMVLLDSVVCSHASSALNKVWEEWTTEHGKSYDNQVGLSSSREQIHHVKFTHGTRSVGVCLFLVFSD